MRISLIITLVNEQAEEIVALPEFVLGVFIDVLAEYGNELLMQFSCNESLQHELIMNIRIIRKTYLKLKDFVSLYASRRREQLKLWFQVSKVSSHCYCLPQSESILQNKERNISFNKY